MHMQVDDATPPGCAPPHQFPNMISKEEKKKGMTKTHRVPMGLKRYSACKGITSVVLPYKMEMLSWRVCV